MRKLLTFLIALGAIAFGVWSPASAQYGGCLGACGTVASALPGPPTLTFVSAITLPQSGSAATSSSVNIGPTAGFTTRRIIMSLSVKGSDAAGTLSSVVINGVTATIHTQAGGGGTPAFAAVVSADVPTGTTGVTVTTTFTNSLFAGVVAGIYSVDDALLVSTTPSSNTGTGSAVSSISTGSFTETAGGFIVAAAALGTVPSGFAITGYTTDALGGANQGIVSHLASVASTGSTTATATWTNSSNATIAAAAWR